MNEVSRTISRNETICDGTPRRENGFRAYVRTEGPDVNKYQQSQIRYWQSPLMKTETDATKWDYAR